VRNNNGLVTNIGVENLGVDDQGNALTDNVTVRLSFFDPGTGALAGQQPMITLAPGQVVQVNDVFRTYGLAGDAAILFVDEVSGSGQVRGYAVMKDVATNDGAFVFMQESPNHSF
jgi:hypothetical protein